MVFFTSVGEHLFRRLPHDRFELFAAMLRALAFQIRRPVHAEEERALRTIAQVQEVRLARGLPPGAGRAQFAP
jgi:hypothetical protein